MAAGLIERQNSVTQDDQLEDIKEYIQFVRSLNEDEKKEFRGIIRGMQTMKDILHSNAV